VSHENFEPKINEVIRLREIMCHSVISIIHHYYIKVKKKPRAIDRKHEKAYNFLRICQRKRYERERCRE
jgi:hypothetical protein